MLPESRERGYKAGRFSFNVSGGRCEACQGEGQRRIEMNFLPDVYVLCEVCGGRRYNHETLAVKYNGYSIADLLEMPVSDALPILENIPQVKQKLQTLVDVGLGYIHLGQSAVTLSGGEAQRIKLARELSKRQTGKTLYLLDEPTTGSALRRRQEAARCLASSDRLGQLDHHYRAQSGCHTKCGLDPRSGPGGRRKWRPHGRAGHAGASGGSEKIVHRSGARRLFRQSQFVLPRRRFSVKEITLFGFFRQSATRASARS